MTDKTAAARENIEGMLVAEMISDFWREFKDDYGTDVHHSSLCAVGPLQTMIGLAIRNGHLRVTDMRDRSARSE